MIWYVNDVLKLAAGMLTGRLVSTSTGCTIPDNNSMMTFFLDEAWRAGFCGVASAGK
jgi:hypothetical protein